MKRAVNWGRRLSEWGLAVWKWHFSRSVSRKNDEKIADGNSSKLSRTKGDDGKQEKNFHPFSHFFCFTFRRMKMWKFFSFPHHHHAVVLVSDDSHNHSLSLMKIYYLCVRFLWKTFSLLRDGKAMKSIIKRSWKKQHEKEFFLLL